MRKLLFFMTFAGSLTLPLSGQVSVFELGTAPTIDGTMGAGEWTNASAALSMNIFFLDDGTPISPPLLPIVQVQ